MAKQGLGLGSIGQALTQHQRQGACGIAQIAADAKQITCPRTAAGQGLAGRHAAKHGHGQA